jgi:D-alanine-D-alanine ligase
MKKRTNANTPVRADQPDREVPPPNSLGPVQNLEAHVPREWWRGIFNSLYLKTDADVVADERITAAEVDTLVELIQPEAGTRMLDLCSGQGRHTLEFARRGYHNIEGLDRSHYLIQRARKQARTEGLPIKFREGDARKIPHPDGTFDVVLILGNSFGYFETLEDDAGVLREVLRVLKPGGSLILDIADGEFLRANYQPRSWEWADKKLFVCRERALSSEGDRLISREIISHTEKGVIADQFYAERLYDRTTIAALVERAGFTQLQLLDGFIPASQRNQDLGMMAQRILLSCVAAKPPIALAPTLAPQLQNITVVMGDPRRPDQVKPAAAFDDDDFHTIEELHQALVNLSSRTFTFLDDHTSLIDDLTKAREEIDLVMNLCDEGYDNDPRKELHVPALLEALGIPYTGAGPQCLAFCYDKSLVRGVAQEMGISVPEGMLVTSSAVALELPIPFPVIVKPNFGDSSFGIVRRSVAHTPLELLDAVSEIRRRFGYDKPILVEEFLPGQDLSVGILGNPPEDYNVLPIVMEDYSHLPEGLPHICGYEAKWLQDSPYWNLRSLPAQLPQKTRNAIIDHCVQLFVRLECRDYARFDWRLDAHGYPKLLEVNPNPGWCWDGHLAKMAHYAGLSYASMLDAILTAAESRLHRDRISLLQTAGVEIA